MKHPHRTLSLSILATIGVLVIIGVMAYRPFQIGQAVSAPSIATGGRLLEKMLNPDGSLNMVTGFSGSLDASGYRMEYMPNGAPRFVPRPASDDDNWDAQFNSPGTSNAVRAMAVISNDLYVGGSFNTAGGVIANYIAKWNGTSWSALGEGLNNSVNALAVFGNELYVGGNFTKAGPVNTNGIAKWNGSWSALDNGISGSGATVFSLISNATDLYVGGQFTMAGTTVASNIAKWNGSNWSALDSGVNAVVRAIAISNNNVYVGGDFNTAGAVSAVRIAKWDGINWSALGTGVNNGTVRALDVIANNLYVGGSFNTVGNMSAKGIARWNGTMWSSIGDVVGTVYALKASGNDLYIGGDFTTVDGVNTNGIAKWDGSNWSALSTGGNGTVLALTTGLLELYIGGGFTKAGGASVSNVAKWTGSTWSALGSGNGLPGIASVYAIKVSGNNIYVGGQFTTAGGVLVNNIAKWDGSAWSGLGGGVSGFTGGFATTVLAIEVINNDVYIGGNFTMAGNVSANGIAKWNGSNWSALGNGGGIVYALKAISNELYLGGQFSLIGGVSASNIAKCNGNNCSALSSGVNNSVYALTAKDNDLYVGGAFTTAGLMGANRIAKWDGISWSALGGGINLGNGNGDNVYALEFVGDDLYAGGEHIAVGNSSSSFLSRWNGSIWFGLPGGSGVDSNVSALAASGSNLYVGGGVTRAGGVASPNKIAKWDGTSWSSPGSGVDSTVRALAFSLGDLYVGGDFTVAGGKPSSYFGRYSCTAPNIITQPIPQSVTVGSSVTFSVAATGTTPLYYQWRKNGSNLNGATGSNFTIMSSTLADAGSYDVVVINGCGNTTSTLAMLTVNTVTIITEPIDGSMVAGLVTIRATGGTGNLTLEVHGTKPVTSSLTPPSGSMTNGTTTWNVSSINDGDEFAITVKDANNVSSATVKVTVRPLIEVKLRIADNCDPYKAWNIDKVPTSSPPGGSLSFVTLSNSGVRYMLPVDSQGKFTSKNMLNCTTPSNCQPALESSLTGPISLNSSADLHYNDSITGDSGGVFVCDTPGVMPRTAKANGQSVVPMQGSPTVSNIDFPLPIFMIHGIESCYHAWDDWVPYLKGKGYIVFTPNHGFYFGKQRDYAIETVSQIYTDLDNLFTQPTAPEYYIIAHSQGGVVSRVMTYEDARVRSQLKRIYTLGTPHSGTDAPVVPAPYLLGDFYMQAIFNFWYYPGFKYRDNSTNIPSDFVFAIGGTSGLLLGLGNDGRVSPQSSVFGINGLIYPYQSFFDHQSEREFPFDHSGLHGQGAISCILENTIIADMHCQPTIACSSASLAGVDRDRHLFVQSSLQATTTTTSTPPVEYQTLTLLAGQTQTASFPISSASAAIFSCSSFGIMTATSIITPSGIVITENNVSSYPGITYETDAFGQRYTVASPQAGYWTMSVIAGSQGGTAYLGAVEQATWQLEGSPDRVAYAAAAPVILQGRLTGDFNGVSSVSSVIATVKNSSGATIATSTLFDDGQHNDAAAGDKVYGNYINAPSTPGSYQVVIQADGVAQGNSFRRQTLSRFDVTPPAHLFTGTFSASALDTNGDTKFDTLDETIGLNVPAAGQYTVAADLFDGNGNLIDHAVQTISPAIAGVQQAVLRFSLPNPSCSSFTSGLKIKNLSVADAVKSLLTLDLWIPDINITSFTGAQFGCTGTIDANLAVSSSVTPNPVSAGNVVTFTVTVSNAGPSAASSVNVANNLPAMARLVSCAATNGGVCGGAGYSSAAITFPTLASGASATITLLASLNAATPNGATLTMVSSVSAATTDTNANNNTATATTQVSNPTAPTIAEFSPSSSSPGTTVAISGTLFTSATSVKFNGTDAAFTVVNSNLILATVPAGATTGLLTVTTPNGMATSASNFSICPATINQTTQNFAIGGGIGNVSVTAATGCAWTAVSNANWIALVNSGGTGSNSVSYVVAPNDGAARMGTITIAGQMFTVSQDGDCSFTINPTSQNFPAVGGSNSVSVTAGTGCAWTATSNAAWITITGGSSGSGNGSVNYSVAANFGPQRLGTITIAGQLFTVNQANCPSITISPTTIPGGTVGIIYNQAFAASGGTASYSFAVTGGALPPGLSFAANGVLTGTPAMAGSFNFIVTAMDANGCTGMLPYSITINARPAISVVAVSRQQGSQVSNSTIANVSDADQLANALVVTVNGAGSTTVNGVEVSAINISELGVVTANILASCTAANASFTLTVTDSAGASINTNLSVTVNPNNAPTLSYNNQSVTSGASITNIPTTATDNGSITGYAVQSQGTYTGMISVNASGVVSISATAPVGTHTITIRTIDNCGATTDATFTLNVGNNPPTITAGTALTRQQGTAGSVSTIATVNDSETPAGNLVVTATTVPAGITITGITNASGIITATVAAGCAAMIGSNTVVLTVTDANSGTATANLTVNVTANAAPTLTYAAASVTAGGATTVNTATAIDNGSITGYSIVSVVPALTTAPTVNASGVVSITNAGPSGEHTITVQATDDCGATTQASFVLTINCPGVTVTAPATNTDTAGVAFSQTFTQTNGIGTTTFSTVSTLPAGLTLSSAGVLSGTPTQTGEFPIVVKATDSNGCQGTVNFTLTINCQTITVNPASLSATSTGAAFSQTFTQSGGIGTIIWSLIGTAPPGLNFNAATASLSGSPTTSGSFSFTIRATDQNACFGERQYTLGVDCAAITVNPANATLAGGTAGTPYSQSFTASGGQTPHSFAVSAGTLPTGLTLSSSGLLSGTPTGFGIFNFTVKATDQNGCFGERAYTLRICAIITLTTSLPVGTTGVGYNQTITASGGASPYGFAVTGGNLPTGLSLNSSGALTGTPTQSGPFTFTVTATDANGCTGAQSYNVTINCQTVTVNPSSLANGFVATSYSQNLTASGGSAPYAFTTSAGTLPGGLTLSSLGALTGTPTAQGTFSFTIRAMDSNGCPGERIFTIRISGNGLQFYPLSRPVRLLDTRAGQGNCDNVGTPISVGTAITTLARVTCESITIPSAAQAIVGNITVVNGSGQAGFLTIYPAGQPLPLAANMIYAPGDILSNAFTVGLDANGQFNIYGERTIDVIVDISGYYAPPLPSGLYYHPLSKSVRLLDTRAGQGNCDSVSAPITGGTSLTTLARATCEGLTIPATAQAIVGNATVINGSGQTGYLTIYPNGVPAPLAANIIYFPGQIISNSFTVSLSAAGEFNIFGERTIDIVVDVAGYYSTEATDANGPGLLFTPLTRPLRILDTRAGQGNCDNIGAPVVGGGSIAAPARLICEGITIPATAQTVIGIVTVVNTTAQLGYMTMYPDGVAQPLAANMIYFPGQVLSNAFVVGLNSGTGQFRIFAERTLEAIVDVSGFFAP